MIERLLPKCVAVAEDISDAPGDEAALTPAERALIAAALPERRSQFAAGRRCARQAMELLGAQPRPVPADSAGAPVWPSSLVGSITHCRGHRAAILARRDSVLELASSTEERAHLSDSAALLPHVRPERLLFSAKEAAYKAWYPLHGTRLGFRDGEVSLSGRACDSSAGILPRSAGRALGGK